MTTSTGRRSHQSVTVGTDLGLLILRGVLGALFIGHGTGKLFGWFNGDGLDATSAFLKSLGYPGGDNIAAFLGLVEVAAGIMLVAGFLVPLAAAMIIGDMINAIDFKSPMGLWIANGGYEYELTVIVSMVVLTLTGPGLYSVDRDREWLGNRAAGAVAAIVLGVVAGVFMLIIKD